MNEIEITRQDILALYFLLSCGASVMCEEFPRCSDDPSESDVREAVSKIKSLADSGYNFSKNENLKSIPQQGMRYIVSIAKCYDDQKTYIDTLNAKIKTLTEKYISLFTREDRKKFEKFVKNESEYSIENMNLTEKVFSSFGLRDSELLIWSLSNKGAVGNGK